MSKYPTPEKKEGRFYCPVCGENYAHRQSYYRHFSREHPDLVNKDSKSHPEISIKRIEEKQIPRDEKLTAMYDAVRDFNQSLKKLDRSRQSISFDVDGDYLAVVGISDLHYGNINVNMDYVDRLLEFVMDTPRAYAFLNGDIIDNWVRLAPSGGIYDQTIKPEYQLEIMINKLKPFKDKILAVVYGNHEGRSQKQGEKNPMVTMADELGIAYLGAGGRINLNFNDITYKMHIRHRFRYESSFNPCHACGRLVEQLDADADIVAIGHKHNPAVEVRYKAGKQRSLMRFGAAMPSTAYSDYLGYPETKLVAPTVLLSGNEKAHHPFIDTDIIKVYLERRK